MKTKTLFIMIGIAVVLSALMVVQRLVTYMAPIEQKVERRLDPNFVKGSATFVQNKPFTLNLDQQIELINIINNSVPFDLAKAPASFTLNKIVIYRFGAPDIEIITRGANDGRIVYQADALSQGALFIEKNPGSLKKLADSTVEL